MATILFDCEFEGTFTDSINGLSPTVIGEGISIESSTRMFGSGCCKQDGTFFISPVNPIPGITLSNPQSLQRPRWGGGPFYFSAEDMKLYWGYPNGAAVYITGDGTYTVPWNAGDFSGSTVDATVVVAELPAADAYASVIDFAGTSLTYAPTEDLITALKADGFTVSVFMQDTQELTLPGVVTITIPPFTTFHIAAVCEKVEGGYNYYVFYRGLLLNNPPTFISEEELDAVINEFFTWELWSAWIDSYQFISGALWTADFTPPSSGISGGGGGGYDRYWVGNIKSNPTVFGWYGINNYAPKFWFQWGNFFAVDPLPDASYSLILYEADAPSAALTGTTSVPSELPAEFQTLLVDFACYVLSLKLKKWKQAARYYNKYINDLNKKRRDFLLRKADEKKRRVLPDQVVYSDGRPWQH